MSSGGPGQTSATPQTSSGYWSFYWPLTLTGLAMWLTRQCQNGTLSRYPDATRELAVFALASSLFFIFNAALVFVPQMTNVLARSPQSRQICLRFVVGVSIALTLPLLAAATLPVGRTLVAAIFGVDDAVAAQITRYLRLLWPLVIVNALRHYCTGLLIQARRSGLVTLLQILSLATLLAVLISGYRAAWPAAYTLGLAQLAAGFTFLALSSLAVRCGCAPFTEERDSLLTYDRVMVFFWPVALTSTMFALSRPTIFVFVSRQPDGERTVAALRLAFDVAVIFLSAVNQFRHVFVTFGSSDTQGVRRFMIRAMLVIVGLMVLATWSPAAELLFTRALGAPPDVSRLARESLWVLCLVPIAMTVRNYGHGLALLHGRTRRMGIGGVCRVLAIYLWCQAWTAAGLLGHVAAAAALLVGFTAEAVVITVAARIRPPGAERRHQ